LRVSGIYVTIVQTKRCGSGKSILTCSSTARRPGRWRFCGCCAAPGMWDGCWAAD